jgi:hypothetical protein
MVPGYGRRVAGLVKIRGLPRSHILAAADFHAQFPRRPEAPGLGLDAELANQRRNRPGESQASDWHRVIRQRVAVARHPGKPAQGVSASSSDPNFQCREYPDNLLRAQINYFPS